MIMRFHEHAFQDLEYVIRAINTKHVRCKCYAFSW